MMKLLKILIMFCLISTGVFAEETVTNSTVKSDKTNESVEKKSENLNPANKDLPVNETGREVISENQKVKSEVSGDETSDKIKKKKNVSSAVKTDVSGNLVELNDGNFKYKRIPGIILAENRASTEISDKKNPEVSEKTVTTVESVKETKEKDEKGIFNFGKNLSDIIARGGILLLITVVFILYRRRNRGTSKKGSRRNVLNSYRK